MSKYSKTSPKKNKTGGHIGSKITQTGVDQGQHTIVVTEIVEASWSKKELIVGEDITLQVETSGYKDGTQITVDIFETDGNSPEICRGTFDKKLSGNKLSFAWKYPENIVPKNGASPQYSIATVYFHAHTPDDSMASGYIPVYSDLHIKVLKEDDSPLANEKIILTRSDGHISPLVTDSAGKVDVKKLPPRNHKVKFPNSSRFAPSDKVITGLSPMPAENIIAALGSKVYVFKLIDTFVYCSHKIDGQRRSAGNMSVFEVAPDSTGKDAYKDEVMILSRTATSLQVNGAKLEKKENEFGMHAFLLKCEQDNKLVPNIFSLDFWKGLVVPKDYPISGLPKPLTVKCYRPDLYKFQIKFPAMRKWSGGTKVENSVANIVNKVTHKKTKMVESRRESTEKKEGWHLNKWPMPISSEAPLKLQRNGSDVTLNFFKSVGAVIELGNKISGIISLIQKNVPKAGWYFEWENQLLQGTFVIEWGWKEYKDNRAYYYIGTNIDIKLIDFKFEIGVGVSGFSFKIQIYGSLIGGVTLSLKLSRYSPDGNGEVAVPFSAEIVGSLGARAEVGCFVKMEGTVETGIKLEDGAFKFRQNEGYSIGCSLKWSGIVVKLKISAGTAKKEGAEEKMDEKASSTFEHEFIGSKELGKWEWSSKHQPEYKPPVISGKDLHDMLVDKLQEGPEIQVKKGENWIGNTYWNKDDVAKEIEKRIARRNDIRMDPKSAEALVLEIRQTLEATMMRRYHGLAAYLDKTQFDLFLDGGDLKHILDNDIDPMLELMNKNS